MTVKLIAAIGFSGQLGLNGKIPWHDAEDLREFKRRTMGDVVVVGRKTFATMPTLPGRTLHLHLRTTTCQQIVDLYPRRTIWIAGGAQIYRLWLLSGLVRSSFITHVAYDGPADTYFPMELK